MGYRNKFIRIGIALLLVVLAGTVGYVLIEGWSWFDSLYMTFITISTVGYKEVHELSRAGQVFTIFVILGGTGTMLYAASTIVQTILEGQLANVFGRRHMKSEIEKLKEHVILCGFGKVGQEVARVFQSEGTSFVVVEANPQIAESAITLGYKSICGDATRDDVLKQAGIFSAHALVSALASDADNLYVTMSAKQLRPDIFIVARVYGPDSESKLKRAGADRTMSPYGVGGRRLAMLTLRPTVVDFFDMTMMTPDRGLVMEAVEIVPGSPLEGLTIRQWQEKGAGVQVLAVKKKNQNLMTNPSPDIIIVIGDELVVAGTREQLKKIE